MQQFIYRKARWFLLSALLLVLFGSFVFYQGVALAQSPSASVASSRMYVAPNVTCTTTPNYNIYNIYSSLVLGGNWALRIGYENAQKTSGFGYCHIVAEHGTGPLKVIAYILDYGQVTGTTATSVTLKGIWPGDGLKYTVVVITKPVLGDGYTKGILTAFQGG